jgi:hypothetical protein
MIALKFITTDGRLTALRRSGIPDDIENGRVLQPTSPGDRGLLDMSLEVMELESQAPAEAVHNSDNNGLDVSSSSSQIESRFPLLNCCLVLH